MEFRHKPVLFEECMAGLAIQPDGIYVDGTLGGGGHSAGILARLGASGQLIGIDRDTDALIAAGARLAHDPRFTALHGNFHDMAELLRGAGIARVDGVLLDLGVSSYQLDAAARGFSYHNDAPLDMRMDRSQPLTAAGVAATYSQAELTRVFRDWGEEKWAAQIARVLCDRRTRVPIETTGQLVDIIDAAIPARVRQKDGSHPARRCFQALRIEVNDELAPLRDALYSAVGLLNPGGRLCVIAFHSLEDRIVKQAFRTLHDPCTCPKSFPVCVCGKRSQGKVITGKPITAAETELAENPRARSATLRIFERNSEPVAAFAGNPRPTRG